MRFESKEFILSRRQSQESQEVKKSDYPKSKSVSERTKDYIRRTNSKTPSSFGSKNSPKEKKISDNHDNNDARDDSASYNVEPPDTTSNQPPLRLDVSKKELQQLAKLRLKRKQELVLAKKKSEKKINQPIVYDPVDAFLEAREAVRQSNKEKAIESSQVIDDLIQYFLPSHMWMGKLMTESKSAVNKIQDMMMVEYDHEYR